MTTRPRVLVIDDSALMREVLQRILTEGGCEVVGTASDPLIAIRRLGSLKPDVITLDVEMPNMNGLDFLSRLMRNMPTPVVMVSSLTEKGADTTLRALELGAVDFVTKPKIDLRDGLVAQGRELLEKVRTAAGVKLARRAAPTPTGPAMPVARMTPRPFIHTTDKVICLGASTGGTEALKEVLCALPPDAPGIVIVQHMPEKFTSQFAQRLDTLTSLHVSEAKDGERVLPGHVYIAPGNRHLRIIRSGAAYLLRLSDEAPLAHHRPAIDLMFESAATALGPNAVAAILTGMGADGARGMKLMHDAGAKTIAQDEATSVVYGMPKEAAAMGGVDTVLPLGRIAHALMELVRGRRAA